VVCLVLLGLKVAVLLAMPYPGSGLPNSDAYDYVGRARTLLETGSLPFSTGADHRPPGYYYSLVPIVAFSTDDHQVTVVTRMAHLALQSAVSVVLFLICWRAFPALACQLAMAVVIGLEPWTYSYTRLIVPEPLVAFLAFFGVVALSASGSTAGRRSAMAGIVIGSSLLSLTFLMRAEMMLVVPILVAIPILAIRRRSRDVLALGIAAAIPFAAVCASNVAYRLGVDGKVRLFGTFNPAYPGLFAWVSTWSAPSRTKFLAVNGWRRGALEVADLPRTAFEDDTEKATIACLFDRMVRTRELTAADDAVFMRVARERVRGHPVRCVLLPRLDSVRVVWIGFDDTYSDVQSLGLVRSPFAVLAALCSLLARTLVLVLACGGACLALSRVFGPLSSPFRLLLVLGTVFVLLRLLTLAALTAIPEPRYVSPAWPFIIMLAMTGLAALLVRYLPMVSVWLPRRPQPGSVAVPPAGVRS
jgi:hypothetical protein